jgi:hypothetical protein
MATRDGALEGESDGDPEGTNEGKLQKVTSRRGLGSDSEGFQTVLCDGDPDANDDPDGDEDGRPGARKTHKDSRRTFHTVGDVILTATHND